MLPAPVMFIQTKPNRLTQKVGVLVSTFLLFLLCLSPAVHAQTITTGDITGVVTDMSGAVVPNADISLTNLDNGQKRTAATNGSGQYRFTSLQPGNYQVSGQVSGLKSDANKVLISIGQVASVDLVLKLETATTTVTVSEAVPLLQNDNANQSTTMTSAQIQICRCPAVTPPPLRSLRPVSL